MTLRGAYGNSHLSLLVSLIGLFFAVGCSGNLKVLGRGCRAFDAQFSDSSAPFQPSQVWQKKVWTGGHFKERPTTVTLREVLKEKDLDCNEVRSLRYTVMQSFWDQIFSMAPFFERMTLKVEVEIKKDKVF